MKKILAIIPIVLLFLWGEMLVPGLNVMQRVDGTAITDDSVGQNDTLWTDTYTYDKYQTAGYFSMGWDLDTINGDVTGEIIFQETNIRNNWNKTTVLVTWATLDFTENALDTTLVLNLIGTKYVRFGMANTSATATDSFFIDDWFIYSAGQGR